MLTGAGVKPLLLPARSPNLNAYSERFVLSIKSECLDRIVPLGEAHLRRAIREYLGHYHGERNHRGLANVLLTGAPPPANTNASVLRRERLGGRSSASPPTRQVTDGGADADGSTVGDGGPTSDGGPAVDAIDADDANVTRDASQGDASAPDLACPDVGTDAGATVDAGDDARDLDAGRPGAAGSGDAPAPRDARADAALGSRSGCSCAVSATGPAANHDQGAAALLLFVGAACLRRRQRRRGH
jgi:MYXO-CTERM domain-containing protein